MDLNLVKQLRENVSGTTQVFEAKTLEEWRERIEEEVGNVDIKPYSHNIISLCLQAIAKDYGVREANQVIEDYELESMGWQKVRETKLKESPMAVNDYDQGDSVKALAAIRSSIGIDSNVRPALAKYLTFSEGTSNKYHYFAIFRIGTEFVAANAYARIGYNPRVDVFARGDEQTVKAAYSKKLAEKAARGYQ